jgi:anti-anti-sigma regulatory factor
MLCQIDCRRESSGLVVHVAGRLDEAHVPDLLEACAHTTRAIIALDALTSADVAGIDALMRLGQQGARLVGLPEYLRLTIDTLAQMRMGVGHAQ